MRQPIRLAWLGASLIVACAPDRPPARPAPVAAPVAHPHSHAIINGNGSTSDHGDNTAHAMTLVDPGVPSGAHVTEAIAVLHPLGGSEVTGTVRFVDRGAEGLGVVAHVDGLPGGTHAFHVHVFGDCSSEDGRSAGPHFHFAGSSFDKDVKIITGNLGELTPHAGGHGDATGVLSEAHLHGPYSILGRAVIVHAKANDPTATPDGAAGDRIACGVIGIAQMMEPKAPQTSSR
jgi:superoxide dismutase, Cu-Zn family